jgi:hypothetical protein
MVLRGKKVVVPVEMDLPDILHSRIVMTRMLWSSVVWADLKLLE